ncbi:MAG TPA: polymer-forming cytoskeletal protein [Treponema sp.]|nr:polymer-forming cytoskeletal protein [Treponema sp.]
MTEVQNDKLDDEDFDTILSKDIEFTGKLECDKPYLIRGKIAGEIYAKDLLVVDEEAVVQANITGKRIIISGSVTGNIEASGRVEITASGKLIGNVTAPEVYMETGCYFNGACTMIKGTATE